MPPNPALGTAVSLVRSLLSTHTYLKSSDMFRLATANVRPVLPAAHVVNEHGQIRMKKVSNIREGKRIWVPPPSAPYPDHPFQSVKFLKSNILASLQAQGLIHNARIERPPKDAAEARELQRTADRSTRRAALMARRARLPPPATPVAPKPVLSDYFWSLGPPPPPGHVSDAARAPYAVGSRDEARWERAEALEVAFWKARAMEDEQIEERRRVRRERFAALRESEKEQKRRDAEDGLTEAVRDEKRRQEALARIEAYARQTGEDVGAWIDELGGADAGAVGDAEPLPVKREPRLGAGAPRPGAREPLWSGRGQGQR
ncbi:hypothetical protein Q5752_000931 [Cryptotrichosporon argae]